MVPTKLTLSNFMCYRADGLPEGPSPLNLDGLHVVCLSGENGAGKSALLEAITWALWGKARMPDDDLIAQGQAEMFVELEFLLDGREYRVRRARQRGGTGKRGGQTAGKSHLDLQLRGDTGWRPLSESQKRETQAEINDVLRMSYQTFINASFLLQGRADEFTARTPSERKEVLADILDLGEYEALAQKAKEKAKDLSGQVTGLRGRIEQLAETAAKLPFWRDEVQNAEVRATALAVGVAQAEEQLREADEARRALEQQAEQRKALLKRLDELRRERDEREHELRDLRERIARDSAVIGRAPAMRAGLDELKVARAEVERLDGLRDRHDLLARRQAELRQQFSEARGELRSRLGTLEQRNAELERRAERREALLAEISVFDTQLVALGPLAVERETCAEDRQALDLRSDQMGELRRRHDGLEAQIKLRQDSLVSVREEQQRIMRGLDRQLADEPRWRQDLAAARIAAARLVEVEARLAAVRDQEQRDVDVVSQQRAECARLKAAADKLKASQKILADAGGSCPVCRSDLGAAGIAHVQAHYEEELAELRAAYADAKGQADAGDGRLKQARAAAADLERELADLRRVAAQIEPLEAQLRQAETWRAERAAAMEIYESASAQISARTFEPAAQAALAAVAAELAALGDPADLARQRKALDQRLRELDQRLRDRARVEGQRHARQDELARVDAEIAERPALLAQIAELRRTIDENDFAHAIRQEGKEVGDAIAALGYGPEGHAAARERAGALASWEREERELMLAEQRLSGDRASLEKSELLQSRAAEELERLTREDAVLAEALRGLPALDARVKELQQALDAARRALSSAQKDLGEKEAYLARAERDAQDLERLRDEERRLVERQGLFAELAEAFGKKGVQAMLIETAIPQIEDEANRLLGRMTDGQMHLSFDMQRDTKKGDTVETLEIKIADALGTRVYDAFSGGEAMRANFAVRIALSRLLARRAGARLETLVIDEGFGTLDALGRERMVEAITSVQDDFRRIIVITHIDELKDRFPAQIEVTKTPAGSRWELR